MKRSNIFLRSIGVQEFFASAQQHVRSSGVQTLAPDANNSSTHQLTNSSTRQFYRTAMWVFILLLFASCSTTSNLPEDEVLYTGMTDIEYDTVTNDAHFINVQTEVEAALAVAPNGALLGSPYYRSPLQSRLWIYNKYANSTSKFGQWMLKSFGSEPVLISAVRPDLRAHVARNVLRNNGYFDAVVCYKTRERKNPKKG